MEQRTDNQYDDDLTVDSDGYGDEFEAGDIDLFEFSGDNESPISRLKTVMLSIDWEITDEVLVQFNEEIVDLKNIWAGDKIKMVYLQALEKISKYIYQQKADSHPNAIKLLLGFYYNLERIELSEDLSDQEKQSTLMEDLDKYERFKVQIDKAPPPTPAAVKETSISDKKPSMDAKDLVDLKATVLGIDWEITDEDLLQLRNEVIELEERYAGNKPRLILLQGLGVLGAYIRKKKSNSHADAFKLLHSFYEALEKIVTYPMSRDEEKTILLPEVEKFNAFKAIVEPTLTPDAIAREEAERGQDGDAAAAGPIAPALADVSEDANHGFQAEEEAASIESRVPGDVNSHIDNFFGEEKEEAVTPDFAAKGSTDEEVGEAKEEVEALSEAFFEPPDDTEIDQAEIDKDTALKGVDVETEADDDSDLEALPVVDGEVAPALVENEAVSAFSEEVLEEDSPENDTADEITGRLDNYFPETEDEPETFSVPADVALQGVDVEHVDDVVENEDEEEYQQALAGSGIFGEPDSMTEDIADSEGPAGTDDSELMSEAEEAVLGSAPTEPEEMLTDVDMPAAMDADEEAMAESLDAMFPDEIDDSEELADVLMADAQEPAETVADELPAAEIEAEEETAAGGVEAAALLSGAAAVAAAAMTDSPTEEEDEVEQEVAAAIAAEAESEEETPDIGDSLSDEMLGGLEAGIQSLGLELDDSVIQGLFTEINGLRQHLSNRPLEKSYLQLISTVVQHVDQFRYEASEESHNLLVAMKDSLTACRSMKTLQAQELLLADTYKVLQWQQDILTEQHAAKAEKIAESETEEAILEGEFYEDEEGTVLADGLAADLELIQEEEESLDQDIAEVLGSAVEDEAAVEPISSDSLEFRDVVRQEMDTLRQTLQEEINELRKALEDKKSSKS